MEQQIIVCTNAWGIQQLTTKTTNSKNCRMSNIQQDGSRHLRKVLPLSFLSPSPTLSLSITSPSPLDVGPSKTSRESGEHCISSHSGVRAEPRPNMNFVHSKAVRKQKPPVAEYHVLCV